MGDAEADVAVLTSSGWKAMPSNYSSLRVLRFLEDGSGTLTYGYGQTIYAIIKCRWAIPRAGVLELTYLESPAYQFFKGFIPEDSNRGKEVGYTLTGGEVEGIESIVARPFEYAWTLELSASPYPEGLQFPYSVPLVFHGHYREPPKPTAGGPDSLTVRAAQPQEEAETPKHDLTVRTGASCRVATRTGKLSGLPGYPNGQLMEKPTIYADFQNADLRGRPRLNCIGTIRDLSRQGIVLQEGMRLILHDEELESEGEVQFSAEEHLWVAVIDWQAIRPISA